MIFSIFPFPNIPSRRSTLNKYNYGDRQRITSCNCVDKYKYLEQHLQWHAMCVLLPDSQVLISSYCSDEMYSHPWACRFLLPFVVDELQIKQIVERTCLVQRICYDKKCTIYPHVLFVDVHWCI